MNTDTPANRNKVCGLRQGLARCGLHPNAPILTEKDTGPDPRSAIARGHRETAALLLDLLQGKEVPHRQVLPAAVIVREST